MVFCDGHAKTILWHAGTSPKWGKVAMPVDPSLWPDWCADPATSVTYDSASNTLACGQIPAKVVSDGVTSYNN